VDADFYDGAIATTEGAVKNLPVLLAMLLPTAAMPADISRDEAPTPSPTVVESVVPLPEIDEAVAPPEVVFRGTALWPMFPALSTPAARPVVGALFADDMGRLYRLPEDQLPPAADPNDFQANPVYAPPNLGVGMQPLILTALVQPAIGTYDSKLPTMGYGLQVRPGVYYDTGAFEGTQTVFRPGRIALDRSPEARERGRIFFHNLPDTLQAIPARLQAAADFSEILGIDHAQLYVDGIHSEDNDLSGRSAFARTYFGDTGALLGKAETVFGDLGSAPMLVAHGGLPIGSVGIVDESTNGFDSVAQFRLTRHWVNDRLESTVSVEEQNELGDIESAATDADMHAWPSFAARLRWSGTNEFDSYQVSALARPIGLIDANFDEHARTGWGLAGIARFCDSAKANAMYIGFVGGEGIGGYVYGDALGAVIDGNGLIDLLSVFGAYVGYQRVWTQTDASHNLSSNIAYGFVAGDDSGPMDSNRKLHQTWCNLLWNATGGAAFGIEYQYALREIVAGNSGDNHRFMFVAEFSTYGNKETYLERTANESRRISRPTLRMRRL
jgi:hypothetical protein